MSSESESISMEVWAAEERVLSTLASGTETTESASVGREI
jgi:hypothetical protein